MPQPIDPQTEIGRITAAERIQQIAERASLAAQTRMTDETELQRVNAESQVHQTRQKSEEVDEELQRHNPFMGRRRKRKRGEKEEQLADHTLYSPHDRGGGADDTFDHDFDVTV